jgi:hypothetical protein
MALADPSLATNPKPCNAAEIERVLRKAIAGDLTPSGEPCGAGDARSAALPVVVHCELIDTSLRSDPRIGKTMRPRAVSGT